MDSETYEDVVTPKPNNVVDGRLHFTCSKVGCKNRVTMPSEWQADEVRSTFAKVGWAHLLDENYCHDHALVAVAKELNLLLLRDRRRSADLPVRDPSSLEVGLVEACRWLRGPGGTQVEQPVLSTDGAVEAQGGKLESGGPSFLSFKCSKRGCASSLSVPRDLSDDAVRDELARQKWVRLGDDTFCPEHALVAVASVLNFIMCVERGEDDSSCTGLDLLRPAAGEPVGRGGDRG